MSKQPIQRSYRDYYAKVIGNENPGFKLVLGGTGLGKTSGIIDLLETFDTNRKFIYCANRIQLLDEMAEGLDERLGKDSYITMPSDAESVYQALSQEWRAGLIQLVEDISVQKVFPSGSSQVKEVKRNIDALVRHIERGLQSRDLNTLQVRSVLDYFRQVLIELGKNKQAKKEHQRLLDHPVIQILFPFIAFKRRKTAKILLVTVQKGFRRFFDGSKGTSLPQLQAEDGNYVIFLDEFDFLESDLIDLVCSAPQIEAPFHFVEVFFREMIRHRLPKEDYPHQKRIRKIIRLVKKLQESGIPFPKINLFTSMSKKDEPAIFQTSRTHINTRLYIKPGKRSFEIVSQAGDGTFDALRMFNVVHAATRQIIYLFKALQVEHPRFYFELLRQCYANHPVFRKQIESITIVHGAEQEESHTEFDALLYEGYGVYEIERLGQESDDEEVGFRHYSIYTTPEKMLHDLACNHLVFGLSATADIPRTVRNFHLEWLSRQSGVQVYPVDGDDRNIIAGLNHTKRLARGTHLTVRRVTAFTDASTSHKRIKSFIELLRRTGRYKSSTEGVDVEAQNYRLGRVENFFKTLLWIVEGETPNADAHLMFYLTFREIEDVLRNDSGELFTAKRIPNSHKLFRGFQVLFQSVEFIIVLYNAELAQNVRSDSEQLNFYNSLFWQKKTVIVITQYSSAGNGVNLQYEPYPDAEKTDFAHIHLMDAPHFFFDRWEYGESESDNIVRIKKNIWYSAKLYAEGTISRARLTTILSNLRDRSLNSRYRSDLATMSDALLNQMAALIQALGRVERVWHEVPSQTVTMSDDVLAIFDKFLFDIEFDDMRANRAEIISSNLQQVFDQVRAITLQERRQSDVKVSRVLINAEEKSVRSIDDLLTRLRHLRKNGKDTQARADWTAIREAVLRLDFGASILSAYRCVFALPYYTNGMLWLGKETLKLYPPYTVGSHVRQHDLNGIYRLIKLNDIVRSHFEQMGFPLEFPAVSETCITPYCYQSILAGALGEEAIKALLEARGVQFDEVPDPLFEMIDMKIAGLVWYIDCKNYTERTMDNFRLGEDDPGWHFRLNEGSFKRHALRKLLTIQNHHADQVNCKLIYLNLAGDSDRLMGYFSLDQEHSSLVQVSNFDDAMVVVVQGILDREHPNSFNREFEYFIGEFFQGQ
jgi:hypothetical protein